MTRTLALVESPAQLLGLLEWALGERDGAPDPARCEVAVLLPRDPVSRRQLGGMAELARAEGIAVGLYDIRGVPAGFPRAVASLVPKLAGAGRLVIGDPFSGIIQRLLWLSRARGLVVVDDGTATLELSRHLLAGRPPSRRHRSGSAPAATAGAARVARAARAVRRTTPGHGRRLEVFSCMTAGLGLPPGGVASLNSYSWTRQRYGPPQVRPGVDLIGTSLAETGLVDPERYVREIVRLADELNAERYFAHRHEDPDKLRLIAEYAELDVVRPELPLEIELLRGPVAETLVGLPSTVLHSLPLALAGTGVEITVCADVLDRLGPNVSPRTTALLEEVIHI
ncbi:hypothetical protein [Streptomyces sp. NPDC050535]|uniref:hypothetical protein n=1 Tax=Streptomyces sp. NPDC050535 TaxID=3365626 RepID=UPI00379F655F